MPTRWQRPARSRDQAVKLGLLLALALAAGPLACAPGGLDTGGVAGTAQALAQTAQAAGGPAETALAHLPATATALAATLAAGATQLAPTENALATEAVNAAHGAATAAAQITPPQVTDEAEASAAITAYAQQVLGLSVTIVKAGGLTGEIQHLINLPAAGNAAQAETAKVAAKSYGAVLSNGAASVSYGSGSVSGDLTVDINAASLGAISVDGGASPRSQAEALALALKVFPALAGQNFIPYPTTQGYSWVAAGQVPGYDAASKQPKLVAQAAMLSVVPAIVVQHALVSAVVGKGDFAANLKP
jgi:hypothetical protein